MRWVLDSNVWIEAVAGIPHASNAIMRAGVVDWCGYSSITRIEVFGFPHLTPADEQRIGVLLGQFHEVLISTAIIDEAIRIRKQVKIKTPDALIAATALVEGADLVTRNLADFAQVPSLKLIDSATL